jgi:hypothetical protein
MLTRYTLYDQLLIGAVRVQAYIVQIGLVLFGGGSGRLPKEQGAAHYCKARFPTRMARWGRWIVAAAHKMTGFGCFIFFS